MIGVWQDIEGDVVAAGPRFLNSYDRPCDSWLLGFVAAGPRFLNSYDQDGAHNQLLLLRLDLGF